MKSLSFLGDCHAKLTIASHITYPDDTTVIAVGDLGMGFNISGTKTPIDYQTNLKQYGIDYFLRGNHDDPEECDAHPQYLGDYGYNEELGIFFISGAWSIDYMYRTEGIDWWRDEELDYDTLNRCFDLYEKVKPKIVVSHDCPFSVAPQMGFKSLMGQWQRNTTSSALDAMFEIHQPNWWVFGHHHSSKYKEINGTKFRCVAELETYILEV